MPLSFPRPAVLCKVPAALALTFALAAPLAAEAPAGAYLAARFASANDDYAAAATYYARALAGDSANVMLQESALVAYLGSGDLDRAARLAQEAGARSPSQIAALVQLAAAGKAGDYAAAGALLDDGLRVGPLVEGLARGWIALGRGQMSEAVRHFDALTAEPGLTAFGAYHKALALASVGDFEGADAIFSGEASRVLRSTRRGVLAYAEILSQLERNDDALAVLEAVFGADPDPEATEMIETLRAGGTLPFSIVTDARDGLAETYLTVAGALRGETPDAYTLVYARLGAYLRPDLADAMLLIGAILEEQGQFDLANAAYAQVSRSSPGFPAAETGRAGALIASGNADEGIEVLEALSRAYPRLPGVWMTLGDALRRAERYPEAATAYDRAVTLYGDPETVGWFLYYARGVALERSGEWDRAEADLKKALELSPDHPQVLNYLGYSWVDMGRNLDAALDMIERAVEARPDDGYIVDSLGWALYRLGRYREAAVQMERAVELTPEDPLINDHLGDVFWAVGRKREARFQWMRALSFEPEAEKDARRIRRKLEIGLDAVLAEEGAPPLRAADKQD